MQIIAYTTNPNALFKAINTRIKDKDLKTWEIQYNDKDEVIYNHSPEQWSGKAMLKPESVNEGLKFKTIRWTGDADPGDAVRGYIVGRFVEVLMVHFSDKFTKLEVK